MKLRFKNNKDIKLTQEEKFKLLDERMDSFRNSNNPKMRKIYEDDLEFMRKIKSVL